MALVSCIAIVSTDLMAGDSTTARDLERGEGWGSKMLAHKHTEDRGEQHGSRLAYA